MSRRFVLCMGVLLGVSGARAAFDPLGYGAAAKGLGGAYVAVAEDGTAAYWNPANLALVDRAQVTASYEDLYGLDLLRYAAVGYTHPRVGNGALSAHLLHLDTTGEADFLKYAESTYMLSYGRPFLFRNLKVGTGFRYYNVLTDGAKATGLGFDLGALWSFREDRLRFGAAWQDLNRPRLDWDTGARDVLPSTLRLGAALRSERGTMLSLQYDERSSEDGVWRAGLAQSLFGDGVTLRGGLHRQKGQEEWGVALGGGLRYRNLQFDYAWETQDSVGDTQTFSLGVRFGS